MQNLKSGKEEIIYLLTKAIDRFKVETGKEIVQNTNRKNYESLAILLSDISNQLPFKHEAWGTEAYSAEINPKGQEYPHRKFDITGGQIKDALSGIVSNPRPFLVDACYVYLFGMGRNAFKLQPTDDKLIAIIANDKKEETIPAENFSADLHSQMSLLQRQHVKRGRAIKIILGFAAALILALVGMLLTYVNDKSAWQTIRNDMNLLSYQPTQSEIDSLEGIWLCYTGSPQARISDPSRYHKVVTNLVDIKYKDGYFTFNRYGASFNHVGYMQFESPGIVSVYSRIKNNTNTTESPRHSLLSLNQDGKYVAAISASWNFDVGDKNKIIGIREIYIKMGKGGTINEVINEIENASCQCKIIRWQQDNKKVQTFYLKNQLLDSLSSTDLKPLIDENSILPSIPQKGMVISKDSIR